MSRRQRKTRAKKRRHTGAATRRVRAATISGSIAATAAIGLTSAGQASATTYDAALFKDINPGGFSNPEDLTVFGGSLLFNATDGIHGTEVWKSDGSVINTQMLTDLNTGGSSNPTSFAPAGSNLLFGATDGADNGTTQHGFELFKTNGTAAGTGLVKDIRPGADSNPYYLAPFGSYVLFDANGGSHGYEVWKSDGSSAHTQEVADINTTGSNGGNSYPTGFTQVGSYALFEAYDGPQDATTHGYELWKTDGTAVNTKLVKDINTNVAVYSGNSYPSRLTALDSNTLLFAAYDDTHGFELWKSVSPFDGTSTTMVKDIHTTDSAHVNHLTKVGSTIFFSATDGPDDNVDKHGDELWKTDGTAPNTQPVKDINPNGDSNPFPLRDVNGTLFFGADDGSHGTELWRSDGTVGGTYMIKDINPGAGGSDLNQFDAIGSTLFFQADDGTHGAEPWSSDGTAGGTQMVKDVNQTSYNSGNSLPGSFTGFSGGVFFTANDGPDDGTTHGQELWRAFPAPAQPPATGGGPTPTTAAPTFNLKAAIAKCKKKFPKGPKRKKCIKKARAKAGI